MKILWVGDALESSGFGKVTYNTCKYLSQYHDVSVLGMSYYGEPHSYSYTIFPCVDPYSLSTDVHGVKRLPNLIERLQPDLVIILQDPWNIPAYLDEIDRRVPLSKRPPIIGYLAVDSRNIDGQPLNRLNGVVVWTDFAKHEIIDGGYKGDIHVCPLGYDPSIYYPSNDKLIHRKNFYPPEIADDPDSFIVGYVGRNQTRKRIDLLLEYFSCWIHLNTINNAYLCLHLAPTGDRGVDIERLARYHGLSGKVIVMTPDFGIGLEESLMPMIYQTFDLFVTLSQAEGWCLPVLEAMACGVCTVIPNCGGLASWASSAFKIPCDHSALTSPMNSRAYTIGSVVSRSATIQALNLLYHDRSLRESIQLKGLTLSQPLTWEASAARFMDIITRRES